MNTTSNLFLHGLLKYFDQEKKEDILQFLPQDILQFLQKEKPKDLNLEEFFSFGLDTLSIMHPSWIRSTFNKYPKKMTPLLIDSLPSSSAKDALQKEFPEKKAVPETIKPFFLQILIDDLQITEHLPLTFLHDHPLSFIGKIQEQPLNQLISFLGIYDLALATKKTVDKTKIQTLYKVLNANQTAFLQVCLQQHIPYLLDMNLNAWHGNATQLLTIIHRRGCIRLGYSLISSPHDLKWHIAIKLPKQDSPLFYHHMHHPIATHEHLVLEQQLVKLSKTLKLYPNL